MGTSIPDDNRVDLCQPGSGHMPTVSLLRRGSRSYTTSFVGYVPSLPEVGSDIPTPDSYDTPSLHSGASTRPDTPLSDVDVHAPAEQTISPRRAKAYGDSLTKTLEERVPRVTQMGFVAISELENPSAAILGRALLSEQHELKNLRQEIGDLKQKQMVPMVRETIIMIARFCGFLSVNDPDYMHGNVSRQKFVNWILGDTNTVAMMKDFFNTASNVPLPTITSAGLFVNIQESVGPVLRLLHGSLDPQSNSVQAILNSSVHGLSFNDMVGVCDFLRQQGFSKLVITITASATTQPPLQPQLLQQPQPSLPNNPPPDAPTPVSLPWYSESEYLQALDSVVQLMIATAKNNGVDLAKGNGVKTWLEALGNDGTSWWRAHQFIQQAENWVTNERYALLDKWAKRQIAAGKLADQAQLNRIASQCNATEAKEIIANTRLTAVETQLSLKNEEMVSTKAQMQEEMGSLKAEISAMKHQFNFLVPGLLIIFAAILALLPHLAHTK